MDTLTCKPVDGSNDEVLFRVYSDVRSEELGMQTWDAGMRDQILRLQYDAQRRGYLEQHPSADWRLILRNGTAIGWVVVERDATALHGIDIALVAGERSRGAGTVIIRALQDEAAAAHQPMVIAVLKSNLRAIALYRRLGFRPANENETHLWMEWRNA